MSDRAVVMDVVINAGAYLTKLYKGITSDRVCGTVSIHFPDYRAKIYNCGLP